jgi:signal transduction histidine kinase
MDEVFRTAQSLTRSLDEIVWAVNPAGDTVEQFATHLCTFAPRFLETAGVRCRLDVPDDLPAVTLPASVRHHLHLGVKETLHNIAKHAQATEVWLRLKLTPDTITLILEDNGRGFQPGSGTAPGADGLANLKQRMKEIGGSFDQQSQTGQGTFTTLSAPLKAEE